MNTVAVVVTIVVLWVLLVALVLVFVSAGRSDYHHVKRESRRRAALGRMTQRPPRP